MLKNIQRRTKLSQINISQAKIAFIFSCFFFLVQSIGVMAVYGNENLPSCPQPRFTQQAPFDYLQLKNPLEANAENLRKGKLLYQVKAKPMACKHCHGITGDGKGPLGMDTNPPPRNFTCAKTINGVPDGQLFWIIKKGSPETEMFSFNELKDDEIWKIILYIRQLAQ